MLLEETELEFAEVKCAHEHITWTEELITDNVQYIGYKCELCGQWVDREDDDETI